MVGRSLALIGRYLTLVGIVEDRCRDGAAFVDVEPLVDALSSGSAEAGEAGIGAADELAAPLDGVERARRRRPGQQRQRRRRETFDDRFHSHNLPHAGGMPAKPRYCLALRRSQTAAGLIDAAQLHAATVHPEIPPKARVQFPATFLWVA